MNNGWAIVIHLLEDDPPVDLPGSSRPENDLDFVDDPRAFIERRFSDHYFQLQTRLEGRKKKKVENNTYLLQHPDNTISVRYYNTDILKVTPDNRIIVDTRGKGADKYYGATSHRGYPHPWAHYGEVQPWHTVSTFARLNQFLPRPWSLYRRKHVWHWTGGIPFTDGDYINAANELKAQAQPTK